MTIKSLPPSDPGPTAPACSEALPAAPVPNEAAAATPAPAPALPLSAPPPAPVSGLAGALIHLSEDESRERIAVSDMLGLMKARAFGPLMIIFAFPNILPSPPGLAGILGLPLVFLACQMVFGRDPWLPGFIARRSVGRAGFAGLTRRILPWIRRAEALMRPRLTAMAGPLAQRLLGLVCLSLAIALALPVPFANLAPALALCLIGLGISERDGLWIGIGLIAAAGALVYVGGLGYAVILSALFVLQNAF